MISKLLNKIGGDDCPHQNTQTLLIFGNKNYFRPGLHYAFEIQVCRICGKVIVKEYQTSEWYEAK
jgi:hypothetical protein